MFGRYLRHIGGDLGTLIKKGFIAKVKFSETVFFIILTSSFNFVRKWRR
jgi:hypothetical protein